MLHIFAVGMFEIDSIPQVYRQENWLPWSHVVTGREAGHSSAGHQLLEEVSYLFDGPFFGG
jgi:hypothetical protein